MDAKLDEEVQLFVFRAFVEDGRPPVPAEIARGLDRTQDEVEGSLRRLADGHVLVLAPGTPYVWMANPLSAIPTPFWVEVGERTFFGNCIWDALGVAAMLHADADVLTSCPDCSEELRLEVRGDRVSGPGVVHYAVPAANWWDDIGFG